MPKNIVILSDGTGQRGGLFVDENRSNIYKLYRAARCGPDTTIDANAQVAYYDPGIGSAPIGLGFFGAVWRRLQNLVSQATGLGLTLNIVDCYAEVLKVWEPGDRIYVFGFSRGAYTVRCLAAVLDLCGVPSLDLDGKPLKRDPASLRRIADHAVKRIYQHVSSPRDAKYIEQRRALAKQFRERCAASDAAPDFVGVFDTVAAVGTWDAILMVAVGAILGVVAIGCILGWIVGSFAIGISTLAFAAVLGIAAELLRTNLKFAVGLPGYTFKKTVHMTRPVLRFADHQLSGNVQFARHAISIDETRASFERVGWANKGQGREGWLKQVWFAGNHSDIGGSYPECESRLSDISFGWMVEEVAALPSALLIDKSLLQLSPGPTGMQHDERKSSWVFRIGKQKLRDPATDAPLHPSVLDRFRAPAVLQHDEKRPYRPEALRDHSLTKAYYSAPSTLLSG